MITFRDNKKKVYFHIIGSIIFIVGSSTLVGFLIQGSQLFSSFLYYMKYASFGIVIGTTFWLGHWTIDFFTKKLNWAKNPKRANIISLMSYIIFGLIFCPLIPYIYDSTLWSDIIGDAIFWDVIIKGLMLFSFDMIVISIFYSTYLTKYWVESIERNEELKRENLLAKYEALKNQVNPHFLFNSLNTLSGVVEQKPELATAFIKKLSDIYRYVLEQSDKEIVSLNDEMKFVDDYIFLLKMRFGDALVFNSNLPTNNSIQIPPLGLQMLVENAIKHNIISDDMPLKIEIGVEKDFIIVQNNFQQKNTVILKNEPLGLENLRKRYQYLSNSSIEIISSKNEFIVKLPIIEA